MTNNTADLYEKVRKIFAEKYNKSAASKWAAGLNKGILGTEWQAAYGTAVGEMLSESLIEVLTPESIDANLMKDIAENVLGKSLTDKHDLITDVSAKAVELGYQKIKVGLKGMTVDVDKSRADGLIQLATESDPEGLQKVLGEPVINFCMHSQDETYRRNCEIASKSGLITLVQRKYDDIGVHSRKDPCKFCLEREGTWEYSDAISHGVFQRHEGCRCTILYTTKKGVTTKSTGRNSGWS